MSHTLGNACLSCARELTDSVRHYLERSIGYFAAADKCRANANALAKAGYVDAVEERQP
jgi:hypothetical protein